jgi:hypothetical protein
MCADELLEERTLPCDVVGSVTFCRRSNAAAPRGYGYILSSKYRDGGATVVPPAMAEMNNGKRKRVLIICMLDDFANGIRGPKIEQFLHVRDHDVQLVDTYSLSRASSKRPSLAGYLPRPGLRRLALYAIEAAKRLFTLRWDFGKRHLSYYLLRAQCVVRSSLLASLLSLDEFDLVICETPYDAQILTRSTSARTFYDCPAPWADELYYDGSLTERQHAALRRWESQLFERVDHLSFHWESYAQYALEQYGISGSNLFTLNFGCTPSANRAQFADPPRVVYMGNLSASFNDTPLLARLASLYPYIDVYGGPSPDPGLGLNYLGYARSLDVLRQYQVGLVTCSKDALRRDGFSSKHLQYIACGLPVLVPNWRRHLDLLRGSIPYDEDNFVSVIQRLSDQAEWHRLSDEAYAQAQRLAWPETLLPLEALLDDLIR